MKIAENPKKMDNDLINDNNHLNSMIMIQFFLKVFNLRLSNQQSIYRRRI